MTATTDPITDSAATSDLTAEYNQLTESITDLQTTRVAVANQLTAAGLEVDSQIKADLENEVEKAQEVVNSLNSALSAAEATKAELDRRVDSGDGSVTPLEMMEAEMKIRSTKGLLKDARNDLRKAERALAPFGADDHLAILASETIKNLTDVPVLVRKKASSLTGVKDAVVLSQTEPTNGYGTINVSGSVGMSFLGGAKISAERLTEALEAGGSEVSASPSSILFQSALFDLPRLFKPSVGAVEMLARDIGAALRVSVNAESTRMTQHGYKVHDSTYREMVWNPVETSLEIVAEAKAVGTIRATFASLGEKPSPAIGRQWINDAIDHLQPVGAHLSAGRVESVEVSDVRIVGPLASDDSFQSISGAPVVRTTELGVTIVVDFAYEPVEV